MNTIKLAVLLLFATFLGGCTEESATRSDAGGEEPIALSGNSGRKATRALADFPNGGSIGVLASVYDEDHKDASNNVIIDWNSYPEIVNAPAKATGFDDSDDSYSFGWGTSGTDDKYWPFDGSELVFMAYSPHTSQAPNNLAQVPGEPAQLAVTLTALNTDTPDVMWASNNGNLTPYSKNPVSDNPTPPLYTSPAVQLGEFRHVLAQLSVEVVADVDMSERIILTELKVDTWKTEGILALADGNFAVASGTNAQSLTIPLISGNIPFKDNPQSKTILLLPGTEDLTQVTITLRDTGSETPLTYEKKVMMPQFENVDTNSTETLKLVAGMNTTLRLVVRSIGVENPNEEIELKGTLSDWDERGKFGVIIN